MLRHARRLAMVMLCAGLCHTDSTTASEIKGILKTGYDFGGDTLFTALFVNGQTGTVKTNEGFYFGGGIAIINHAETIATEITLSWKFQDLNANNGDVRWERFPLETLVFYRASKIRIGAGLTYHINPQLEGDGVLQGLNIAFRNALGAIVQTDYFVTPSVSVGVRFTWLEYEQETTGAKFDSSGGGVTFGINF